MSHSIIYLGLDVHKDSITIAKPRWTHLKSSHSRVERLSLPVGRRWLVHRDGPTGWTRGDQLCGTIAGMRSRLPWKGIAPAWGGGEHTAQ